MKHLPIRLGSARSDSCQSSAQAYFQNAAIPWRQGSDNKGYITLWPSSPNPGTCWDVSSPQSLKRGGGGDSQAIANMILHAVAEYGADPARVYLTGGSSGAMMGNVMAARTCCRPSASTRACRPAASSARPARWPRGTTRAAAARAGRARSSGA
ncbi:hypothetical protein VTG60DRAFT_2219 [Thermothelomyces hinnuleus]